MKKAPIVGSFCLSDFVELAEKYGQTHNGIIRFALKKLSEE